MASREEIAEFETDVLSGFVLARAAAGLADSTIRADVANLEQVRAWLGRPVWEMGPTDADGYFGKVLRQSAKNTRLARAQALKTYFCFLELRHKVEIHALAASLSARSTKSTGLAVNNGHRCGFRPAQSRFIGCSRAGGRIWSAAESSHRQHATSPPLG